MAAEERNTTHALGEALPQTEHPAEAEAPGGHPLEGVYRRLFHEGYRFDFYQAVRLLEKLFPEAPRPGMGGDLREERIFFRPDTALVFPGTDVKAVDLLDAGEPAERARLSVTFMGLYGMGSPLPVYFYDILTIEEKESFALRDFLDIFNHRFYAYFYRAWKKYRPEVHTGAPDEGAHAKRFLGLAGLGTTGALHQSLEPSTMRLAAYAGRLAPRVRHAEGLRGLLRGLLGDIGVRIIENVPRWVPIPVRSRMGSAGGGMQLGITTTIGTRVRDVSGKFRVVLGPLTFAAYREFLPGKPTAKRFDYLVRLYAPDYLDYDVELQLDTSDIPPVQLGAGDVQLGMTAWLGKPADDITVLHVTY